MKDPGHFIAPETHTEKTVSLSWWTMVDDLYSRTSCFFMRAGRQDVSPRLSSKVHTTNVLVWVTEWVKRDEAVMWGSLIKNSMVTQDSDEIHNSCVIVVALVPYLDFKRSTSSVSNLLFYRFTKVYSWLQSCLFYSTSQYPVTKSIPPISSSSNFFVDPDHDPLFVLFWHCHFHGLFALLRLPPSSKLRYHAYFNHVWVSTKLLINHSSHLPVPYLVGTVFIEVFSEVESKVCHEKVVPVL